MNPTIEMGRFERVSDQEKSLRLLILKLADAEGQRIGALTGVSNPGEGQKVGGLIEMSVIIGNLLALTNALKNELPRRSPEIAAVILKCACELSPKSAIYATLVGLLNAEHPDFGLDVASKAFAALHDEVNRGHALHVKLLVRFIVELGNVGVVDKQSLLEFLQDLVQKATALRYGSDAFRGGYHHHSV